MALSVEKGEQHILVKVTDKELSNKTIQAIQEKILHLWEDSNDNVVLYFPELEVEAPNGMSFMKDLSDQAQEKGCSLIIAGNNSALTHFAEENQISHAPSREEAVDLVFLEGIERGFNEEDESGLL